MSFFRYSNLKSLPDNSKWNISNVKNMSGMFCGLSELKSLPDISNWDTSNVENISGLFTNCERIV